MFLKFYQGWSKKNWYFQIPYGRGGLHHHLHILDQGGLFWVHNFRIEKSHHEDGLYAFYCRNMDICCIFVASNLEKGGCKRREIQYLYQVCLVCDSDCCELKTESPAWTGLPITCGKFSATKIVCVRRVKTLYLPLSNQPLPEVGVLNAGIVLLPAH